MNDFSLHNWIPAGLQKMDGQLQCHWLNTFGLPFSEPFFNQTILKCRAMDSRHAMINSVSDLAMIAEWGSDISSVEPRAFIFHISRCGSTLVTQLLAESAQNIVVSEVPFFDDILRLPYKEPGFTETITSELLSAAINFYGRKNNDTESRLFIKTDSWHLFFYGQLRALYPQVPFILIYRSPDEVFASHSKIKGMQVVPGLIEPDILGFKPDEIVYNDLDAYLTSVLEKYFLKSLELAGTDDHLLLLNYNEGPMQMVKKIASFTNMTIGAEDWQKMTERTRYHSKKPGERFESGAAESIIPYPGKARELYHLLEKKRITAK